MAPRPIFYLLSTGILGAGVLAGVGGGIIFGGYKARHELNSRNPHLKKDYLPIDYEKYVHPALLSSREVADKVQEKVDCPMSGNFERMVDQEARKRLSRRTIASFVV